MSIYKMFPGKKIFDCNLILFILYGICIGSAAENKEMSVDPFGGKIRFNVSESNISVEKAPPTRPPTAEDDVVLIFLKSMINEVVQSWVTHDSDVQSLADSMILSMPSVVSSRSDTSKISNRSLGGQTRSMPVDIDMPELHKKEPVTMLEPEDDVEEESIPDWRPVVPDEDVTVVLKNGDTYRGHVHRLMKHGTGIFTWTNGTRYEGNFIRNNVTGVGKMIWSDLSWYTGEFLRGYRHGAGTFSIGYTTMFYHGEWSGGMKHGHGSLLYGREMFYEGDWDKDMYHGKGLRQYTDGTVYYGEWKQGNRDGNGRVCWPNNDFYSGGWKDGLMDGYGEYTWNTFKNNQFVFPMENIYKGYWSKGQRNGLGMLIFGYLSGARYEGYFYNDKKHGKGAVLCGNGRVVSHHPLFLHDMVVHIFKNANFYAQPIDREEMVLFVPTNKRTNTRRGKRVKLMSRAGECNAQECGECCDRKYDYKNEVEYFQSKTIGIPIHQAEYEVDMSSILQQVCEKFNFRIAHKETENAKEDEADKGRSTRRNDLSVALIEYPDQPEYEEVCVKNCLLYNLSRLWDIYHYFANISAKDDCSHSSNTRNIMVRMFLWQMYRNCWVVDKLSLVRVDELLADNKVSYVDMIHDPLESIYFWQFILSLLSVAWELYNNLPIEGLITRGVLAAALQTFLDRDIYPNVYNNNGSVLFEYRDIAPIESMYDYYRSLSEPMTARHFLSLSIPKNDEDPPIWTHPINVRSFHPDDYNGTNTVDIGAELMFLSRKKNFFEQPQPDDCGEQPAEEQSIYDYSLMYFRDIGIEEMVQSLYEICPMIARDGYIVNIDYKMVFLEFYEVLAACLLKYHGFLHEQRKLTMSMLLRTFSNQKQQINDALLRNLKDGKLSGNKHLDEMGRKAAKAKLKKSRYFDEPACASTLSERSNYSNI